jgi:hypothetical protein
MKKRINFWVINFFLAAMTSFLLNCGVFAGNTGGIPLKKGKMGAVKLSGKKHSSPVQGDSLVVRHQVRINLGQGIRTRGP